MSATLGGTAGVRQMICDFAKNRRWFREHTGPCWAFRCEPSVDSAQDRVSQVRRRTRQGHWTRTAKRVSVRLRPVLSCARGYSTQTGHGAVPPGTWAPPRVLPAPQGAGVGGGGWRERRLLPVTHTRASMRGF